MIDNAEQSTEGNKPYQTMLELARKVIRGFI